METGLVEMAWVLGGGLETAIVAEIGTGSRSGENGNMSDPFVACFLEEKIENELAPMNLNLE